MDLVETAANVQAAEQSARALHERRAALDVKVRECRRVVSPLHGGETPLDVLRAHAALPGLELELAELDAEIAAAGKRLRAARHADVAGKLPEYLARLKPKIQKRQKLLDQAVVVEREIAAWLAEVRSDLGDDVAVRYAGVRWRELFREQDASSYDHRTKALAAAGLL